MRSLKDNIFIKIHKLSRGLSRRDRGWAATRLRETFACFMRTASGHRWNHTGLRSVNRVWESGRLPLQIFQDDSLIPPFLQFLMVSFYFELRKKKKMISTNCFYHNARSRSRCCKLSICLNSRQIFFGQMFTFFRAHETKPLKSLLTFPA
jgi:hypothetical protein